MPLLTDEELKAMAHGVVHAAVMEDWDLVNEALHPLWHPTGDVGDGYLLITLLIQVILDAVPMASCPEHGSACLEIKFATRSADGMSLVPDDYAPDPGDAAFMTMVKALFVDDMDAAVAAYCEAVQARVAHEVLWTTIRNAGHVTRQRVAGLQ